MLIGYDLSQDWTYGIVDGDWLTSDVEMLHSFSPAERVRMSFNTTDPQTISTSTSITAQRPSAIIPQVGCVIGLSVPPGTRIDVTGMRASDGGYTYDLGGNSQGQRTTELADGTVGIWWAFAPGLDAIVGWQITIYNDAHGSPFLAAGAAVDIGQVVICAASKVSIKPGWQDGRKNPSVSRRTLGAQLQYVQRTSYRTMRLGPCLKKQDHAFGEALGNGMDWQRLIAKLAARPFTVCVPRTIDLDEMQRTAAFGVVQNEPGIKHIQGPWSEMTDIIFDEVPA